MYFDNASEEVFKSLRSWKFTLDNPTLLGWTVVAAYFIAAVCCGRAALKARGRSQKSWPAIWWILAGGLVFLGINKQLNLQTLMIVVGRNVSSKGGWYGTRRQVQRIFSIIFASFFIGGLAWFWWGCRDFFRKNRLILAGTVVLVLFVVIRAASINHSVGFLGFNLRDEQWAWVLEIAGAVCLGIGAAQAWCISEM